jgi:prepilin-type processing-associated H-X9-DG protein
VNAATITDGLSNTIAFSEMVYAVNNPQRAKGGFSKNSFESHIHAPDVLLSRRDGNGNLIGTYESQFKGGQVWMDGASYFAVFNTILPPNSPSGGPNIFNQTLVSASSNHANGVNCLFADGSVHFINESIQTQNLGQIAGSAQPRSDNYNGPSIYGVWGALGSAVGGEQSTIP